MRSIRDHAFDTSSHFSQKNSMMETKQSHDCKSIQAWLGHAPDILDGDVMLLGEKFFQPTYFRRANMYMTPTQIGVLALLFFFCLFSLEAVEENDLKLSK